MSKNIWYVTKYFEPKNESTYGGRSWSIVKGLSDAGCKMTVVTSDSNNLAKLPDLDSRVTLEDIDGVTICWLKTMKYGVAKSLARILSWLHFELNLFLLDKNKLDKPDVIIVSSLSLITILNGFLLRKKFGCKLVFEIRDIWPLTLVEEGGFNESNIFIKALAYVEKLGYEKSDVIVGTMPNLKEHVEEVLGHQKEVYCIPMGLNNDQLEYSMPLSEECKEYMSSDKFKVVYAGTIGITNALESFFEVAESLQARDDIEFILVGDGALKKQYMTQYSHLNNLIFVPKIPRKMVQSILSEADLLYFSVYNSKVWHYGQSLNKVIDYMLSGKPIVASYTGYPSMINEAGSGTFVEVGDSEALTKEIERYSNMKLEEREEIGARGRTWLIENRKYDVLAGEYARLLFN
ncbi:glycosyltransferase family 4 protein [Bacterioplanoides sp.]|uniref:glycosyltransferase family 4 protein n=1 Tax=Bacterioplanoides sp. TaxID=2066072 RepID=UPI003B00F0AD